MELSGILLLFLLGIRHGFDPDHIAIIDGVSIRYTATRPSLAKWAGTLFAIGHSTVVTLIAIMVSAFSHSIDLPGRVWNILEWIPGLLLIGVGLVNARMLLRRGRYSPKGIRSWLLPQKLKESSNPLAIILIGALFAMVFDTTTQAAAWAYTASANINRALLLGLCFSAGMISTDTLDSRILYQLTSRSGDDLSVVNYRRALGWFIVVLSFLVGGYKILTRLIPSWEISEGVLTIIGISFFGALGVFYIGAVLSKSKRIQPKNHGH